MAETQTNKLKARQKKETLTIKKRKFVGIHKLETRDRPMEIPSMQRYYPYLGEQPGPGINLTKKSERSRSLKDLARVKTRHVGLPIKTPATHEVHLNAATITAATREVQEPGTQIGVMFNLYGNVRGLLKRRGGITAIIAGAENHEALYYVLQWKDVLDDPFREPNPQTKEEALDLIQRKRERSRYPTDALTRTEQGRKVYYLAIATPDELKLVLTAFRSAE